MKKQNVIKAAMELKEVNVKEIASHAKVDGSMVHRCIRGTRNSPKVTKAIDELLQPELNLIDQVDMLRDIPGISPDVRLAIEGAVS